MNSWVLVELERHRGAEGCFIIREGFNGQTLISHTAHHTSCAERQSSHEPSSATHRRHCGRLVWGADSESLGLVLLMQDGRIERLEGNGVLLILIHRWILHTRKF